VTTPTEGGFTIWRRKRVELESGWGRSTIYVRVGEGLWPKPVHIGPRAVGWVAAEVRAVNAARIAGKSDDDIRALVRRLEADRTAYTVCCG
jgi:prophage regulatory protein